DIRLRVPHKELKISLSIHRTDAVCVPGIYLHPHHHTKASTRVVPCLIQNKEKSILSFAKRLIRCYWKRNKRDGGRHATNGLCRIKVRTDAHRSHQGQPP